MRTEEFVKDYAEALNYCEFLEGVLIECKGKHDGKAKWIRARLARAKNRVRWLDQTYMQQLRHDEPEKYRMMMAERNRIKKLNIKKDGRAKRESADTADG